MSSHRPPVSPIRTWVDFRRLKRVLVFGRYAGPSLRRGGIAGTHARAAHADNDREASTAAPIAHRRRAFNLESSMFCTILFARFFSRLTREVKVKQLFALTSLGSDTMICLLICRHNYSPLRWLFNVLPNIVNLSGLRFVCAY